MRPMRLVRARLISAPLLALLAVALAAAQPSRVPMLDAADREGLTKHFGQNVFVLGTVASADWSGTGKVMNIEFAGAEGEGLLAVVFENQRERFDAAFAGDFIQTVRGRRVRLRGRVNEYGGYLEEFKGRPQIILNSPEQVTLLLAPGERPLATRPTTRATTSATDRATTRPATRPFAGDDD